MSLFVLSSKDGWVNIMYDGLDAVGIDQQVNVLQSPDVLLSGTSCLGDSDVFWSPGRTTHWAARVLHWVAFTAAAPHVVHKQALMMDFLIRVMVPEEDHMCHCTVASWKAWQEQTHTRWETNRNVAKEALLSLHVMWHFQRKIKSLRWVVPRHSYSNTLCLIFLCFWRSHNNRETLTMSPHLKKLNKLEPIFN